MCFDIGSAVGASSSVGIYSRPAPGSVNSENEEPLLKKRGIEPDQIWKKAKSILNQFRARRSFSEATSTSDPEE